MSIKLLTINAIRDLAQDYLNMEDCAQQHIPEFLEKWAYCIGGQAALAKKLGVSPAYVNDIVHRRRGISRRLAERILKCGQD